MYRYTMLLILAMMSSLVTADMEYEVGAYNTFYEGNTTGLKLRVGNSNWPVYLWGSSETTSTRILGQEVAGIDMLAVGLGVEHKWDEFSVFFDAGYAFLNEDVNSIIRDEVVYTELVRNHESATRPVPAADPTRPYGFGGQDPKYHPDNARTMYKTSDSFLGRVGVGYQIHNNVKITASYRFLAPKEHFELWDIPQRENGGGWWEESRDLNMSAWEIGIYATF